MRANRPALAFASFPIIVLLAASSAFPQSKAAAPPQCKAYFTALEADEVTVGVPMLGLNKPQLKWYRKNANNGKFPGICYLDMAGGRMSVEEFSSRENSGTIQEPNVVPGVPIYVVAWGQQLKTETYIHNYQTLEHVNGTDANGNATGANVPVTHTQSGKTQYYEADGILMRWDDSVHSFISILPLPHRTRTIRAGVTITTTSSPLQDGLKAIEKRLDSGTP